MLNFSRESEFRDLVSSTDSPIKEKILLTEKKEVNKNHEVPAVQEQFYTTEEHEKQQHHEDENEITHTKQGEEPQSEKQPTESKKLTEKTEN